MTTAVRQDSSRTIYIVLPLVFFFLSSSSFSLTTGPIEYCITLVIIPYYTSRLPRDGNHPRQLILILKSFVNNPYMIPWMHAEGRTNKSSNSTDGRLRLFSNGRVAQHKQHQVIDEDCRSVVSIQASSYRATVVVKKKHYIKLNDFRFPFSKDRSHACASLKAAVIHPEYILQ